jgi:hypothetical protein
MSISQKIQQNSNFEEFFELLRRVSILPVDNYQLANSKLRMKKTNLNRKITRNVKFILFETADSQFLYRE